MIRRGILDHPHDAPVPRSTCRRPARRTHGFAVDTTEDPGAFAPRNLKRYAVVVWLLTTGDVLDPAQQAAFAHYVRAGGGYVGVHSASDTEYDWRFYGDLVGAYFQAHPAIQPATVNVAPAFAATARLPRRWSRTDEWYDFRANPRGRVRVLAAVDEATYAGGGMGTDHPIAWCHRSGRGRAWYTAMGHTTESWSEAPFLRHLAAGLRYAAGGPRAGCPR